MIVYLCLTFEFQNRFIHPFRTKFQCPVRLHGLAGAFNLVLTARLCIVLAVGPVHSGGTDTLLEPKEWKKMCLFGSLSDVSSESGKLLGCWNLGGWLNDPSVSSVAQPCPALCRTMDCSTPGLPVHHQLPEFTQTHVHRVGDAIQPSHPLLSPSPPAFTLSQHQTLFKWVSSSHQVAKVLELQHQSFQWTPRTDLL